MDLITFIFLLFAAFIIAFDIALLWWLSDMFIPLVAGGGPYVPSRPEAVDNMIALAKLSHSDSVIDLGSGDGRILIAAISAGAGRAVGYEIHPGLVKLSRQKAINAKVSSKVTIVRKTMWKAHLNGANVVFLFQIPYSMKKLRDKIETELPPGTRIISNAFEVPGRKPISTLGKARLYIT